MTNEELMQKALRQAEAAQERVGMIHLPDGNWYDYGTSEEEYLSRQCAMLADQNIAVRADYLYELQPSSERRYSERQIQGWLDRHPNYAEGRY